MCLLQGPSGENGRPGIDGAQVSNKKNTLKDS